MQVSQDQPLAQVVQGSSQSTMTLATSTKVLHVHCGAIAPAPVVAELAKRICQDTMTEGCDTLALQTCVSSSAIEGDVNVSHLYATSKLNKDDVEDMHDRCILTLLGMAMDCQAHSNASLPGATIRVVTALHSSDLRGKSKRRVENLFKCAEVITGLANDAEAFQQRCDELRLDKPMSCLKNPLACSSFGKIFLTSHPSLL